MATNTALSRNQLVGYIKAVKDLEVLKYMQISAIESLERNIYYCNNVINSQDYAYVQANKKRQYRTDSDFKTNTLVWMFILGSIVAIAMMIYAAEESGSSPLFAIIFRFGKLFPIALKGFLIGAACVLVIAYLIDFKNKKSEEHRYNQEYQLSNHRATEENRRISQQNAALEQQRRIARKQIDIYNKEIHRINRDLVHINNLLANYYRCNVIYPKYRNNLIYICSLYEYFDSQRCDSLTGPNGAYNLLEADIKFGVLVDRLDLINQKLDQIIDNQRELYYAIEQCNASISRLEMSLNTLSSQVDTIGAKQEEQLQRIDYNTHVSSEYQRIYTQFTIYRSLLN